MAAKRIKIDNASSKFRRQSQKREQVSVSAMTYSNVKNLCRDAQKHLITLMLSDTIRLGKNEYC